MARWEKEPIHKLKYKRYTFYYDTASELGRLAFESGLKMPNPYDPVNKDYDDYDDAYIEARDEYINSKINH